MAPISRIASPKANFELRKCFRVASKNKEVFCFIKEVFLKHFLI